MTVWTPTNSTPPQSWSEQVRALVRTFSPYVFSRAPVFDTGTVQGIWDAKVTPPEIWTPES